jgi:hypothetical protein
MMKNSLALLGTAARTLLRNWPALLLINLLYALLLATLDLFISTREATIPQLSFTVLLALAAPVLFFMIQAAGINYIRTAGARALLGRALRDFFKLLLISVPMIALGVLIYYLLNKLQAHFPVPPFEPSHETSRAALYASSTTQATPPPMPLHWPSILISTLRILLLFVFLPLMTIQLWIALTHEGIGATFKRLHRVLGRAFTGQAILIYAVGLLLFGLLPYFLTFTRTPIKNAWGELIIFGLRLLLAFVLTLWGWVITMGALTGNALDADTSIATAPSESFQQGNLESAPVTQPTA